MRRILIYEPGIPTISVASSQIMMLSHREIDALRRPGMSCMMSDDG
jgi:hypothetical protein